MVPKIKNNSRWGFVSGRISVLEGRLLPREFFLNLIAQEHLGDLIQHLQDTFLRDYLTPGTVWDDFSDICDRCFYEMALSLRGDSPSSLPADLFLLQGDYLNLKNALTGSSDFPFPFRIALSGQSFSRSVTAITVIFPLFDREPRQGLPAEAGEIDPAILEIILDGAYLRNLLSISARTEVGARHGVYSRQGAFSHCHYPLACREAAAVAPPLPAIPASPR